MTTAPAVDLLGTAMVDFADGRRSPVWLRVASGRRLAHDLAAYFAPVTVQERALLDLVEGPALDVGCGPARHARLLQARGLTAIGLDRSLLALGLARSLGLRHWGARRRLLRPAAASPRGPAARRQPWPGRYAATAGADYWACLSLDAPLKWRASSRA